MKLRTSGLDLRLLGRDAKAAGRAVELQMRRELRASAAPMVADIRARFERLPGTGRRAARSVRASAGTQKLTVALGDKRTPFALGREFGATKRQDRAGRRINYSSPAIFGPWTGNRFTLGAGAISGHAFQPGVRAGIDDLTDRLETAVGNIMGSIGGAR